MIASFIQTHPAVTTELAYSNRPLHMIEEGCDAGIIAGTLIDEAVVARSLGRIKRYPVAAPRFLADRKSPKTPKDLQSWPWLSLSNAQFGGATSIEMFAAQGEQRLEIKPVMISEGVTSLCEATRMALGVAVLPEWLIEDDLLSGRLVRVLPKWQPRELPAHVVYPARGGCPPVSEHSLILPSSIWARSSSPASGSRRRLIPEQLSSGGAAVACSQETGHGQLLIDPDLIKLFCFCSGCRCRRGRGKREGDHRVTQCKTLARVAAKAIDDVLDAIDLINGCRGICAARVGHGQGIEDPQDLTRRRTRGIEEPGAVAEEDQVACHGHARVGAIVSMGIVQATCPVSVFIAP